MSGIRPVRRDDVPALVAMFRRIFPESAAPEALAPYIERILFDGPFVDEDMPSWAYENKDGRVDGFLGVVSHRLKNKDRELRVAVSSYFMVDPESRSSLAGVQLLRKLFQGPQDLTIAEGNAASRKLWDRLGGMTSILYSLHWASPLRPSRYVLDQAGTSPALAPVRWLAKLPDWFARRSRRSPFRRAAPAIQVEELTPATFVEAVELIGAEYDIWPCYDEASAAWFFEHLARKRMLGSLRKTLVRDEDGGILGWAIWFAAPGDTCQVVSLASRAGGERVVLDHLAHAAAECGGVVLAGRLEPRFMTELGAHVALISRTHTWTMLHASDPELLRTIQDGRALMSRLEGEWWVPYRENAAPE